MSRRDDRMRKKTLKEIVKILVFVALVNLPFITMTQLLGVDGFIDSFTNHNYYQYYKTDELALDNPHQSYIIIEKATHPDFSIQTGDKIFYVADEGGLSCRSVDHITTVGFLEKYYVVNFQNTIEKPIFKSQILGKVIGTIDDSMWNSVSLKIWDLSINNLNAIALFSNP
jgi:hypothetical protein